MSSGPKGKRPGRDRRSLLSDEDHALWQHTASTLDPVRRAKPRVHAAIETGAGVELAPPRPRLKHEARVLSSDDVADPVPAANLSHKPQARVVPSPSEIERKAARRIRSGRTEIEARIDLHGMRQSEAHSALRAFLLSCHARDKRWVLVITGKGGTQGPGHEEPTGWWGNGGSERGVLRRNVPRWLNEPDLRAIVVSFSEAAIRHGGEGALYVQLRKRNRAGQSFSD